MPATKSKGAALIELLMSQLDPGSERFGVLQTARRFKSSWVELGEKLLKVQSCSLFLDWGYGSFEDYCSREIRIKQPTAQKLTQAYRYLEQEEPQLLTRQEELQPLPDFRAVDLLRRVSEDTTLPEEALANLRQAVLQDAIGPGAARKRLIDLTSGTTQPKPLQTEATTALAALKRLQKSLEPVPELEARYHEQLMLLRQDLEGCLSSPIAPNAV